MAIEVHSGLGAVADVLGSGVLPPDVSPQYLHLLLVSVIGGEPRVHSSGFESVIGALAPPPSFLVMTLLTDLL